MSTVDLRVDQDLDVPVDQLRARFIELGDERDKLVAECAIQASRISALCKALTRACVDYGFCYACMQRSAFPGRGSYKAFTIKTITHTADCVLVASADLPPKR